MYDAIASLFGVQTLWTATMEPEEPEEEYGGNSINDPNPSGNPDEDDPGSEGS
jgi:hypothetical protein